MCDKACYESRSEAQGFIRRFRAGKKSLSARGKALYAYHCKVCGFWHLTSMARKKGRLIGRAIKRSKWLEEGE